MGRKLMISALSRATAMSGVRQVNLGVNAANAGAVSFYESIGFEAFGLERGFMLLNGELHDEIHMVRIVDATARAIPPE